MTELELEIKIHDLVSELSKLFLKEKNIYIKERYMRFISILVFLELNENIDSDILKLEAQIEKFRNQVLILQTL